jgi:hypothetical protein
VHHKKRALKRENASHIEASFKSNENKLMLEDASNALETKRMNLTLESSSLTP